MNHLKFILTLFMALLGFFTLVGQSLSTEGVVTDGQITDQEKTTILAAVNNKWEVFVSSSDLSNEEDRDNFLSIFDFDASHYVDYKQNPVFDSIGISEYVEKTQQDLGSGLVFLIENPRLVSIGVSEDFNFFAEIIFTKTFNEYIDAGGKIKFVNSGLASEQTMRFAIDSYETEKAYIVSIKGADLKRDYVEIKKDPVAEDAIIEEPIVEKPEIQTQEWNKEKRSKKSTKKKDDPITFKGVESIFSPSLKAGLGSGSLERSDDAALQRAILGESPATGIEYLGLGGLNLNFRRSVGSSQKLYLNFGLGLELGKINVDISNFKHGLESAGYTNNAFIDNSARGNRTDGLPEVQTFEGQDIMNEATVFLLGDASIEGGMESSSIFLLNFSPGISYKIFQSGSSLTSVFLDVGLELNYLVGNGNNNITYEGTSKDGYKIPNGLFPKEDAIKALSNSDDSEFDNLRSILQMNYKTNGEDNINDLLSTTSSNNLFYGAKVGFTLQRKINYGFGLELGAHYNIGFTPIYSMADQESGFLEGSLNETRNASIVEQYYPDTKLNRLSLRVGLFFLLNQN